MKELTKDLPVNMREYSIPNIEKNLVESIFEGTSFSDINRSNMSYSVMDKITYNSRAGENHLDVDGNPKHTVPLFYSYDLSTSPDYTTRQVETAERKSYDLGKVLAMYGRMAYNYENMNNIDNSVKMLRRTLADSKQIQTKSDGAPVMKSLSNTFLKKLTSADTLEVFDDFVNAELYGITRKGKEFTFSKKAKIRRKDKDGKYVEKEKTPRQILFEEIFGPSYESHCKVLKTSFNKDSCGVCSGKKVWELFYDSLNRATKLTIIFREKLVYSEYYRYDSLNRLIFSKRTVGEKYACCFLNDDGYVIAYNNYFSSGELIVIKQYSYSSDTITRTSFDSLENKAITKFVYDKNGNLAYKVGYDYRSKKVENKKWTIIYDTKNNPTSISYFLDDKIIYKTEKEYFY